jgi:hypothetical protein
MPVVETKEGDQMSDSKPCPVLQSNDGTIRERCATCPHRKPVSVEGLVKRMEAAQTFGLTEMGKAVNSGIREAMRLTREYQKEVNNG